MCASSIFNNQWKNEKKNLEQQHISINENNYNLFSILATEA